MRLVICNKESLELRVSLRFLVVGCLGCSLGFWFRSQSCFNKWLRTVFNGVGYWDPRMFLDLLHTIRSLLAIVICFGAKLFLIDKNATRLFFGWFTNWQVGFFTKPRDQYENYDLVHLSSPLFWRYRNGAGLLRHNTSSLVSLLPTYDEKARVLRCIDAVVPSGGFAIEDGFIIPDATAGYSVLSLFYSLWFRAVLQRQKTFLRVTKIA